MLRKKLLLLIMLVTLLVSLSAGRGARACSGDQCGCGETAAWCRESCVAELPPGSARFACIGQCNRESLACARECCDPYNIDPDPYHNY